MGDGPNLFVESRNVGKSLEYRTPSIFGGLGGGGFGGWGVGGEGGHLEGSCFENNRAQEVIAGGGSSSALDNRTSLGRGAERHLRAGLR